MNSTPDPAQIYSDRSGSYVRFVRSMLYPQGLRGYFLGSPRLESDLRILDAGCGTGIVTLALRDALLRRGLAPRSFHGFDLTPAMLDRFRATLARREIDGIELTQADVLQLDRLPDGWNDYDLIVSASMFEYLPPERLGEGLGGLRRLLKKDGCFVLFITRRNWLMRPLIGRWWQANLYTHSELERAFGQAGFTSVRFGQFPLQFRHLALWGHIVEARA